MNEIQTRRPTFIMGILALLAFGCSDPSVSQPRRDAQVDFGADQGLPPVLDMRPDARMLGSFGDPCSDGDECLSRFCIEALESGRICTKLCGECPPGYECNPVANDGPDRTFICTTDQPDLCKPCQTDRDCDDNEDRCLTIGHNQYCGEDCSEDGVCPDGYECADFNSEGEEGIHQCVPANNEGCQPCRDEDGDGYGDGPDCLGFDCRDDNPLIYEGAPEICDGRDNNCNSEVDEPALLTPAPEEIVCLADGVCRGTRVECIDGGWICNYPESYEEGVEVSCDGLDNDCDGTADDDLDLTNDPLNCAFCGNACDFPNAAGECFDSACELGDCGEGWFNVDGNDGNGCEYNCNLTQNGEEVCDQIDNDCDGSQDEGFDTQTDPSHCGACNRLCELPNATPSCIEGQCGIEDCNAGWVDRNAEHLDGCEFECDLSNEGVEICDGLDNDCDGGVDEDFDFEGLEHCGGCDQACGFDNGLAACDGGECALVGCLDGWFDPNVNLEDGCEYACVLSRDGIEACDTIDNDCDSNIDEDFDLTSNAEHCGGCGRACFFANGVGICADSTCALDSCVDGFWNVDGVDINGCEYVCEQNNGGIEACDQADNDCDGALDEDFDVLSDSNHCGRCNNACILDNALSRCGLGNCLISECIGGFWDIDGETANGCEYACQPTNEGVEVCDEIDNDCDGATDEDFDFNTDVEHCGGCGESCGANNGTVECQDAGCVFTGCAEGFYDLDGSPDNGCEYACEFVQAIDVPDVEGVDANCDGIDGNAMSAVFVAGDGSPNGLGTQDDPLDSINAGIALAANGGISQVLVSTGNYDETVDVVNGISLYGSYSRNDGWARDLDAFESRINGEPIGLRIEGINRSTYVQGFTITSANGTQSGESSIAMHATNVQPGSLVISHCRLLAGDGADGEAGNNGQRGDSGQAGSPGGAGCDGCSGGGVGGGGGASTCNQGGSGGRGGHNGSNSGAGANGGGGNGGRGGTAVGTGCEIGGRAGANGRVGGSGVHGRGGNGGGRVTDGAWVGDVGRDGRIGSDGGGGGGASGGGGTTSCTRCGNAPCDLLLGCVCNADRGGGGGGGGGAGCGGHGGLGGSAGGGSFAAFLISADVTFEVSELQSGRGGNGGAGGAGANGGVGASGADGGTGQDDSGPGSRGGQGGNGGRGGDGGGGSGGVSYALYTSMANPMIDADTLLVAGAGGEGGPGQRAGTAGNAAQQN